MICVSFDGQSKEVFEARRVGSDCENVMKNIRQKRAQNPLVEIELNVCVTRLNIGELGDIVRLGVDIGVARVVFNPLTTRQYPHLEPFAIGADDLPERRARIAEVVGGE